MPFINEFVSEEDIEKYDLDALWNHYRTRDGMPRLRLRGAVKHYWTIDRSCDTWLYYMDVVYSQSPEISRSGYPEPTEENIFIFSKNGIHYDFRLKKSKDSTKSIYEKPFIIKWELIRVNYETPPHQPPTQHTTQLLKESLVVFGFDGAYMQVVDTTVLFGF